MNHELAAIAERARVAVDKIDRCEPGAAIAARQVLVHDIAPIIARMRYLERQLADAQPGTVTMEHG